MNDTIDVSVIVPSYNHERFVADAVTSVLDQKGVRCEVIAIDDGSDDGSLARLEELDDPRLRRFAQENQGLSRTLNRGLELARGRWVKMLPSDDLLEAGALAEQLAQVRERELELVFCRPNLVDAEGRTLTDPTPQAWFDVEAQDSAALLRALVPRNPLCAPSALFERRLALAVGGFDPSLRVAQDYDLWLRMLPRARACLFPQRLVRIRWHGANQSAVVTGSSEAERAYALVGALVRDGLGAWTARYPSSGRMDLARALVDSGLSEVRPFARALLVELRAAGEPIPAHAELDGLLTEAPELARSGSWTGLSACRPPWSRP